MLEFTLTLLLAMAFIDIEIYIELFLCEQSSEKTSQWGAPFTEDVDHFGSLFRVIGSISFPIWKAYGPRKPHADSDAQPNVSL